MGTMRVERRRWIRLQTKLADGRQLCSDRRAFVKQLPPSTTNSSKSTFNKPLGLYIEL